MFTLKSISNVYTQINIQLPGGPQLQLCCAYPMLLSYLYLNNNSAHALANIFLCLALVGGVGRGGTRLGLFAFISCHFRIKYDSE